MPYSRDPRGKKNPSREEGLVTCVAPCLIFPSWLGAWDSHGVLVIHDGQKLVHG